MVNQSPSPGPRYLLDKVLAVALVAWLLFFGGFSQVKIWLTPERLRQVAQVAETIKTGAARVTAGDPAAAPGLARPIGAPAAPPPANQAAAEAQADAAYQATVQAVNAAQPPAVVAPAVVQPMALPTAVVRISTVPPVSQITVVPQSMPIVYAQSGPVLPTPIPTMAYPTPLPVAAAAYELSSDGKCVTVAARGGRYQACQDWPYSAAEANSVADYLRTGLVPGVKVN